MNGKNRTIHIEPNKTRQRRYRLGRPESIDRAWIDQTVASPCRPLWLCIPRMHPSAAGPTQTPIRGRALDDNGKRPTGSTGHGYRNISLVASSQSVWARNITLFICPVVPGRIPCCRYILSGGVAVGTAPNRQNGLRHIEEARLMRHSRMQYAIGLARTNGNTKRSCAVLVWRSQQSIALVYRQRTVVTFSQTRALTDNEHGLGRNQPVAL